jgi:hypothetical protein
VRAPNVGCPMATQRADHEPFAWWLARERIGQGLRGRYPVLQDLPAGLLMLIEELATTSERRSLRGFGN